MNKKNLPLIIALCIPILMILLVAGFIYLPSLGNKPKYNFLYMTGNSYSYLGGNQYIVSGGHLTYNPPPPPNNGDLVIKPDNSLPHFYLYNVAQNTATEVFFGQARNYTLDSSNTSPDGYVVVRGNYSGGDLFFGGGGGDYNSWFIKGHNRSRKLNLKLTGSDYYNFQFLGWTQNN